MVIQKEKQEKRKTEIELVVEMLEEMAFRPISVISLAYVFAVNFAETGADVAKRWETVAEQNAQLQVVYNRGYEAGLLQRQKDDEVRAEWKRNRERKEEEKEYPLGRNDWQE